MVRAIAAMLVGLMILASVTLPAGAAAVKATVNGTTITDIQVAQRLKLFQLEGRSGSKAALDELINEALMLQEAKRMGIAISDAQVSDAMLNVARNIKVSSDKLVQILNQNGVNVDTLRDRLRAALAWNQVTQQAIMPRVQLSDLELEKKAEAKLDQSNSFDYILKEVIFVMPGGKGSASARTADANRYRKSFQGCDNAVKLSLSYTDAAVVDVGRRHATQMPEAIAKELAGLNVGGITKPRVVETGVSMLAVCSKAVAGDTTFIKGNLRQQAGNEALKTETEAYLKGLRGKAKIVYE
ncbi:MAG: SurA N-terminal domain-containing protein [Devosia sp.]|nr:SurA N-terminal domain-containing protein [Devosia sp.]